MRGGRFLEAPVSGSKKSAELGKLTILAAGDRSLYMDAYSCFEALGKKTFFLGEMLAIELIFFCAIIQATVSVLNCS